MQSPAERLDQSRAQLRRALQEGAAPKPGENDPLTGRPRIRTWLERIRSISGASFAIDAVELWWSRHPMRVPVTLAIATATSAARPLAKQHPLALMAGALVVGALFVWSRPLRWALKPALFAGLLPQLLLTVLKSEPRQNDRPKLP